MKYSSWSRFGDPSRLRKGGSVVPPSGGMLGRDDSEVLVFPYNQDSA
jgi:hypothetical protein